MPGYNGKGPEEAGPMTGRGRGLCGGAMMGPRYGHGYGPNCGVRPGHGRGPGREAGWFSAGYDDTAAGAGTSNILEKKRAFLLAELGRTEALLGGMPASEVVQANKEAKK